MDEASPSRATTAVSETPLPIASADGGPEDESFVCLLAGDSRSCVLADQRASSPSVTLPETAGKAELCREENPRGRSASRLQSGNGISRGACTGKVGVAPQRSLRPSSRAAAVSPVSGRSQLSVRSLTTPLQGDRAPSLSFGETSLPARGERRARCSPEVGWEETAPKRQHTPKDGP